MNMDKFDCRIKTLEGMEDSLRVRIFKLEDTVEEILHVLKDLQESSPEINKYRVIKDIVRTM